MRSRVAFGTVLAAAMAAATLALAVFAVLASELIDEFGVARWQIGILVTATSLGGAVASPSIGSVVDRVGSRRSTVATLVIGGLALLAIAGAPVYWLLVVAALICGIAQALGNPATNKLISENVPAGKRGTITGIKQSGVQMGTFLAGITLPALAVTMGWRWAVTIFAFVILAGAVLAWRTLPADPVVEPDAANAVRAKLPRYIWLLSVYGFLLGAAGTAIFSYLPLYSEEALGFSPAAAGATLSLAGLVGIFGRIGWSTFAEARVGADRVLLVIGCLAAVATSLLFAAPSVPWLVWPAAVVAGMSASSWNSVGMLAVIQTLPASDTGRGSGIVLFGFMGGLGIGAPAFGFSVDQLGSYGPGWAFMTGVFVVAAILMWRHVMRTVRRSAHRPTV